MNDSPPPLRSSYIICTWNRPDDLSDCVRSILAQNHLPHELIIVDASSPAIAQENQVTLGELMAGAPLEFSYHSTLRASLPFQRNVGIEAASGDVCFFVDDDVILSPDYNRAMLDLYERYWNTDVGGIQASAQEFQIESRTRRLFRAIFLPERRAIRLFNRVHSTGFQYVLPIPQTAGEVVQVEWLSGYAMSYRREVFNHFRFDESLDGYASAEDKDFSYRVSQQYRLLQALRVKLHHKRSPVARPTPAQLSEMSTLNRHYLFRKNMPQHAGNQIAYRWAAFGFLLWAGYKSILFRDAGYLTGTLRGIAHILRGTGHPQAARRDPVPATALSTSRFPTPWYSALLKPAQGSGLSNTCIIDAVGSFDMPKQTKKKRSLNGKEESPIPQDAQLFINREIALLAFFWRVLEEAQDDTNPLLERIKFLAIVGSILAEFFMTRVSALKQQVEAGVVKRSIDGLTPAEQLTLVREDAVRLMNESRKCLYEILPQLERAGIHICSYRELNPEQKEYAGEYYERVVFPVLTPLAYDPARPFPHISNMSLNLAVLIRDQRGQERFARVKVPNVLPRLVPVPAPPDSPLGHESYVWMDQLISAHLEMLFPGMKILEAYSFRVTRDAEVVIQELEADDLLETIERGVKKRRFGEVVRMTVDPKMPSGLRRILVENLELEPDDIYVLEPPLGMSDLFGLYSAIDRPDLKYQPFAPHYPSLLRETDDTFVAVRERDILLHHPYDSFLPVVEFLQEAARDRNVLAIKMTLYRVGKNAPVVQGLLDAVRNGKQVAVLVELKARFDEESNIEWAKQLEAEGVHVVYGLLGLKTHSKIALVVREEGDEIRRYLHLSTGNYNAVTAQQYTDIGLLTSDEAMGADASDLFNFLTGYSAKEDYHKFLVAPINLRSRLEELIEREMQHASKGENAHIIIKTNSLVDEEMIRHFYRASQGGVKIDLLVRGMCCLRPGIKGISDNIRVTSIVGRFLEHSRIYYFHNAGDEQVFLGSADVRTRNLDRRVEILFPIENARLVRHIRDDILKIYLADNVKARQLLPDGSYVRVKPEAGQEKINAQEWFIAHRGKNDMH